MSLQNNLVDTALARGYYNSSEVQIGRRLIMIMI